MSQRDPIQTVLDRLEGVKQTGSAQWQARCPAHDDRHASLSVARRDDGRGASRQLVPHERPKAGLGQPRLRWVGPVLTRGADSGVLFGEAIIHG